MKTLFLFALLLIPFCATASELAISFYGVSHHYSNPTERSHLNESNVGAGIGLQINTDDHRTGIEIGAYRDSLDNTALISSVYKQLRFGGRFLVGLGVGYVQSPSYFHDEQTGFVLPLVSVDITRRWTINASYAPAIAHNGDTTASVSMFYLTWRPE